MPEVGAVNNNAVVPPPAPLPPAPEPAPAEEPLPIERQQQPTPQGTNNPTAETEIGGTVNVIT